MEWAAAAVSLRPTGGRRPVRLGVETSGCDCRIGRAGTGASPSGALPLSLFVIAIFATRRARTTRRNPVAGNDSNTPGTFAGGSRATSTPMYPVPSRAPTDDAEPELDESTLARAKAGDRVAQAAIVHRYERPVFALLWRMLGPQRALVEDLTQETFLRVLRALSRFEDDGRARMVTWILSIAARLALDHLRASRPRTDAALAPGAIPVALPQPDQEATRRALAIALLAAVERLAPPFRAAFLLREVHGLSYDEISLALSIDVGTVKSRLARARAALQAALAEMHDE
jgi:RNA polymerase sigma-70 factor (ECF subfamily)